MSAAHTPGPWRLSAESKTIIVQDLSGIGTDGVLIGSASSHPNSGFFPNDEEGIANARLIAAAPDLLELHKKHMELMMEIAQEMKSPRLPLGATVAASVRMLAIAAKESLDAIAKATGGQS